MASSARDANHLSWTFAPEIGSSQWNPLPVGQDVPFHSRLAAIGRIWAREVAPLGRLDDRAIEGRPLKIQTLAVVIEPDKSFKDLREHASAAPRLEPRMAGRARPKTFRQRLPLTTRSQAVHDSCQNGSCRRRWAAALWSWSIRRQYRPHLLPQNIGYVSKAHAHRLHDVHSPWLRKAHRLSSLGSAVPVSVSLQAYKPTDLK